MRKFLTAFNTFKQPFSHKLLLTRFTSGYVLAIIFFKFYGPRFHHFIESITQGL